MYPGGKSGAGVYQTIINQMPPHRVYIESFLGAGAVMRRKQPARESIGIDADRNALALWTGKETPHLKLIHGDALEFLSSYTFQGDELVYCDPPYLMETRAGGRSLYDEEFGDRAQHEALLKVLLSLPCMVMVSGYASSLYTAILQHWRTVSYQAMTRGGTLRTEWLWMNYAAPVELHDYRYLGMNFRERERIKRKRERWKRKLHAMPLLERYAILWAIRDIAIVTDDDDGRRDIATFDDASSSRDRIASSDDEGPKRT